MVNFLIRVEGSDKEFTSLLPLLVVLLKKFPEGRINIITDENFIVPSEWLPSRCYVFNIPDSKKETVFGVHHFAANLHEVFNIDYYIDFVNDFYSAFLGLNFRAKKKIGLAGGPKSYLYNVSMESFSGMFPDQKKISVLEHIEGIGLEDVEYIESDIVREYDKVLFDLSFIEDEGAQEKVSALIQSFEGMKLYGYVPREMEEDFDRPELMNKLEIFSEFKKDILSNIQRFDIVISDSLLFCQLALLAGRRTLLILPEGQQLEVFNSMTSSHCCLYYEGNDLIKYGIDEARDLRVLGEVQDYILNYFNLRLEPS